MNSKKIIAIECRSIEDKQWGVGRSLAKFLEEIYKNPKMAQGLSFILYFHRKVPDYDFLKSPLFKKKILCPGVFKFIPFYIYYFVMVPILALWDRTYATYYPNYMLPIIHLGKSIVVLTEDVFMEARRSDVGISHRLGYIVFSTWASWFTTKIMAVSETSKVEVAKLFKIEDERVFANPHGVDFKKIPEDNNFTRDNNQYLTFGQAFPRRHMKEIFQAFDVLAEADNRIRLIAIGVDKYNPKILKEMADSINLKHSRQVIEYKEYVSDDELIKYFLTSFGCLYVSFNEAFGIPPVEALSLGCLPIVANTPVTHEIFEDNAFFINKEHDYKEIANCIKNIGNNPGKISEILEYKNKILSKYTWENHAKRLIKKFNEL